MNEQRIAELQLKWLKGDISEDEAEEFARWYNSDQDAPLRIPADIATSKAEHQWKMFKKIKQQLDLTADKLPHERIPANIKWWNFYASAAACLLAISGVILWLNMQDSAQISKDLMDVSPGSSGLVITLANGDELAVDSLSDGLIASEDGVDIIKKNGMVYYSGKANALATNVAATKRGRKFKLSLPDGSRVWLNAASSIKYPTSFEGTERTVETTGEVYFEVSPDANKPFVVLSGKQKIVVIGTHFNVNSYANEKAVVTTLLEGKVRVITNGRGVYLTPNHQAILLKESSVINVKAVDATIATGWINDVFSMHDTDLATLMRQIARWYDVEVRYEPDVDKNQTFYGSTPMNQNLSEVLKVLELGGVKSSIEDNVILIHKSTKSVHP